MPVSMLARAAAIWLAILAGHMTRCTLSVIRFNQGEWRHIAVGFTS